MALAGTPARKISEFPRRVSATIAKWNSAGESPVLDSVDMPRRATFKTAPGLITGTVRPPGDSGTPNPRRPLLQVQQGPTQAVLRRFFLGQGWSTL